MIVLQNNRGEHLGFCLIHPNLEATSGKCIFSIIPANSELFEAPETQYFFHLREQGEHQWSRLENGALEICFQGQLSLGLQEDGSIWDGSKTIGKWLIHQKSST